MTNVEPRCNASIRVLQEYAELIAMVPSAVRRRHANIAKEGSKKPVNGLKFSRPDFVRDVLFSEDGFGLIPTVFTKSTQKLEEHEQIPSTSAKDHLPYFTDEPFVPLLMDYQRLEKMRGTYVGKPEHTVPGKTEEDPPVEVEATGFWKYIHNGIIHPSFLLHRTVTGRHFCLTGDTPITVLDPRGSVPISYIQEGDWVWTYGDNLVPIPALVSRSGRTLRRARLVQVVFRTQGARERKAIRCTPDHLFRLRSGGYIRADALEAGHRLLSVECYENVAGYRSMYHTGRKERVLEHRMVLGVLDANMHVHHLNEQKLDNRPENLIELTPQEHMSFHLPTPERIARRERTRHFNRSLLSLDHYLPPARREPRVHFSSQWAQLVLRQAGGKPTVFRDTFGFDYTTAIKALERAGVDWRSIREEYNHRGELIAELLPLARECTTVGEAARVLGVSFYKARHLLADDRNHEVVEVQTLIEREDVYGMAVHGADNFIANGVCVRSDHPSGT